MTRLVELAIFYDPEEALCAQGAVRAGGCFTLLQNEHHLATAPWLRVALGGYRLCVLEDDAERARLVLGNALDDTVPAEPADAVLEDNAADKHIRSRKNWLWLPVVFATTIPFVPTFKNGRTLLYQLLVGSPFYLMIAFVYMR